MSGEEMLLTKEIRSKWFVLNTKNNKVSGPWVDYKQALDMALHIEMVGVKYFKFKPTLEAYGK